MRVDFFGAPPDLPDAAAGLEPLPAGLPFSGWDIDTHLKSSLVRTGIDAAHDQVNDFIDIIEKIVVGPVHELSSGQMFDHAQNHRADDIRD